MITFVEGQIFDSPAQVLTNTVNTVGVMGKGIALEFKNRYPDMFLDYKNRCNQGHVRIGHPYLWENELTQVLNFPTKEHWREKSKLEYIDKGLKYLQENYQSMGICTLALAPLGCGNGGLYWPDVKRLMIHYLEPLPDLEVFAYLPWVTAANSESHTHKKNHVAGVASKKYASSPNASE